MHMVDHIHQHREVLKPIEVRTSVERRRRWPVDLKGRIVATSFAPGAIAADVAREYHISPAHLHQWRRAARSGKLVVAMDADVGFATVVVDHPRTGVSGRFVEIDVAGAVVRVDPGADLGRVVQIIHALKAAT